MTGGSRRPHRGWIPALLATFALLASGMSPSFADEDSDDQSGLHAEITDDAITLGNGLVERTWRRTGFGTVSLQDLRAGGKSWGGAAPDFTLDLGPADLDSTSFDAVDVEVDEIGGREGPGLRLRISLEGPGIDATRIVKVYEGVAGFRTRTILSPTTPLALFGYTLDEAAVGGDATPTIHAFRAGADWRDPIDGWDGPPLAVGDPHAGTWRDSHSAGPGESLAGPAQWISLDDGERSAFLVMERNDHPSSRARYDGTRAQLVVDVSKDVLNAGPFEEQFHVENPTDAPARHRLVRPGQSLALEPAFVGFGSHEGDEAWQFHKYLTRHRLEPYELDVTFNSNGTDSNRISTGAKDDMDFATIQEVAPKAKALGVDTFILDDGWQAISGDWYPDCPEHPEPRNARDPVKFAPRFPDCDFTAVREEIAPMKLGLWWTPMHFHNESATFKAHPEWACTPIGQGLAAYNASSPESSSNEAGLGTWGPNVIPHIEERLRVAIEDWQVSYFKFDFLVWLDCAEYGDLYDYREAFMAMVDRLQSDYPEVTFQIDETNDYRLFPFESVARGPSWFQNGSPPPRTLLHNLWNLSPYVPSFSIGQHFLGGSRGGYPVDTLMATALPSHLTYFSDMRNLSDADIAAARPWTDFYKANKDLFRHATYPLLNDPIDNGWTALQKWNPEAGEGALLAFRQEDASQSVSIPLVNVPAGREFDLFIAPTGERIGRVTSEDLTSGYEVTLPEPRTTHVVAIRPATSDPDPDPTSTGTPTVEPSPTATPTEDPGPQTTELSFTDRSAGSGQYSDDATIEVRLRDSAGEPVAGEPISFDLVGEESRSFSAVTDEHGVASKTIVLTEKPGAYQLFARYEGSDAYQASATTTGFVIEREDTALSLVVEGSGSQRRVIATLADDDSTEGIGGRAIDFWAEANAICRPSPETDRDGRAVCEPPAPYKGGKREFMATFSGDDYYLPSEARAR